MSRCWTRWWPGGLVDRLVALDRVKAAADAEGGKIRALGQLAHGRAAHRPGVGAVARRPPGEQEGDPLGVVGRRVVANQIVRGGMQLEAGMLLQELSAHGLAIERREVLLVAPL